MNQTHSHTVLCWFRNDLRLNDNPMIASALKRKQKIHFVYILEEDPSIPNLGAATKWWLHHSLASLDLSLSKKNNTLILKKGSPKEIIVDLCKKLHCDTVLWNRRYEPNQIKIDTDIKSSLKESNITVETFPGNVLIEPWEFLNKQNKPYQVFTPFWNALKTLPLGQTLEISHNSFPKNPEKQIQSLSLAELNLLPKIEWDTGFHWKAGEKAAVNTLRQFISQEELSYEESRNVPSLNGTSKLSPHLHFGEISPRTIWKECFHFMQSNKSEQTQKQILSFLREIVWREFSVHLLYHFPQSPQKPLRNDFVKFPWGKNRKHLTQWQKGLTGYPIIDAGMRQLWQTGWMHNRVRMIVASFLVKNLMIHWKEGASWFWDTLVDADLANNTMGWQWVAGCGADAAPFFRIFNPIIQGEKFDPNGDYVKTWIPELKSLNAKWIHKPFATPKEILNQASITLGKTYPLPIVDLATTREHALECYKKLRS